MNTADIIIAAIIVIVIAVAVALAVRRRRRGNSCCGNCGACPMCKDEKRDEK